MKSFIKKHIKISLGFVTIKFEVFLNILFLSFKINQSQKEIEKKYRERQSKTNPNNSLMTHLISARQLFWPTEHRTLFLVVGL